MRKDIVPGAVFPDYELSDHTAKRRKLSELQGQHPMVLVLSRGGYCPKDRRQAEGLVQLHRELEVGYCRLVTISTDNITETNEYRTGVGAHWPFLSDVRRTVQKDLDIAEYTDPNHNPMIPHVIVATHARRSPPGPADRLPEVPSGLGHYNAGTQGRMGGGAQGPLLSVRQDLCPNTRGAGLAETALRRGTNVGSWE
jgi:peroxiredoxin